MEDNNFSRMQQLAGLIVENEVKEETTSEAINTPADVKALAGAQKVATSVQNKAKAINNIQEFPGAFEAWFTTLGFQPGKVNKSQIRTAVESTLTKLGYK
jgi:hypothetical protein